ncbi:hypothetical protein EJ06DRAFT_560394 [Trichodelitschia bisporula]|uniref:DUF6604 domain-containing protein n=1 Tax=Trichodelitschia bisporula TaxID=703511 RepID=A0A6G1HIP5_9PEZI|nr:hypothetical protein EJ06DRAFT_560394 [Trichodelitschia bisporula]
MAEAPTMLSDIWTRYQHDLGCIAQWLVEAVKKKGYDMPAVQSGAQEVKISLEEMRDMAEFATQKNVTVLKPVVEILERLFKLRLAATVEFWGEEHTHMLQGQQCLFLDVFTPIYHQWKPKATEGGFKKYQNSKIPRYVVVEVHNAEEKFSSIDHFQVFSIFEHLHQLRDFSKETWEEYRRGDISLMSAATMSNAALKSGKAFLTQHAKVWRGKLRIPELFLDVQRCRKIFSQAPGPPVQMEYYSPFGKWAFVPAMWAIETLIDHLPTDKVFPAVAPDLIGDLNCEIDGKNLSDHAKMVNIRCLLWVVLTELRVMPVCPVRDEMTCVLQEILTLKREEANLYHAFALQVLVDTYDVMRPDLDRPLSHAQVYGERIQKVVDRYVEFIDTLPRPSLWPQEEYEQICKLGEDTKNWLQTDIFDKRKQWTRGYAKEDFVYMLLVPHFCGAFVFDRYIRLQKLGLRMACKRSTVVQTAFLYNLVQIEGDAGIEWPDMEHAILTHKIWSKPPTTIVRCSRALFHAIGVHAHAEKLGHARPQSRFESPTPIVKLLRDGIFTGESIDKIIAALDLEPVTAVVAQENETKNLTEDLRKWATPPVSNMKLLAALKEELVAEEGKLSFDYLGMHERCFEICKQVAKAVKDLLVKEFGKNWLPAPAYVPNVAMLVHRVASTTPDVIDVCQKVMREYLPGKGVAAMKDIEDFTKFVRSDEDRKRAAFWLLHDVSLQQLSTNALYWNLFKRERERADD